MSRPFIDITGQVFNRWTVIKKIKKDKWRNTHWLCKCICNKEKIVTGSSLKNNTSKSCGCLQKEIARKNSILPDGEANFNALYYKYRRNGIKRDLEFNLTKEQAKILFKGDCYYCGIKPLQKHTYKKSNGEYFYNGIDRVDNTKGYNIDNCVSCCGTCNHAKHNMSQDNFFVLIKKIFNKLENNYEE